MKVKSVFSDINLKEKDISVVLSDDTSNRIRQFVVLNREYKEDENGRYIPNSTDYINTSYGINGYGVLKKAFFSSGVIVLELVYKEKTVMIELDISSVQFSDDAIKYLKFILKNKIEFTKAKVTV